MEGFNSRSAFYLHFFERDLQKMKDELLQYQQEEDIWKTRDFISNSAGNLFLHIMGNLRHFIGAALAQSGYVRNRDYEFAAVGVPLQQLLAEWELTMKDLSVGLNNVSDEGMQENFPFLKHGETKSVEYMLQHLYSHLNYHLGQINYHRRLISS